MSDPLNPDDEIIIDDDDPHNPLSPVIIGSLPSPERVEIRHEVNHTHFTPDGKILSCRCGWRSHLCSSDEDAEIEWLEHL